jgi:FtsZ-binding cell division protein ZapB
VKQKLGSLLHQNGVLKRAVLIQHNRLKDYEEMEREHSRLKQIIENYQEQIKALEVSFLFYFFLL